MSMMFWGVRLVRNFEAIVAMAAFAVMILVVLGNVVIRFTTGMSLVFTEEIAYLAFGYSVFFGVALLFRHRAMIVVDLVVDLLPERIRHVANIVNYLILIVVCGYFFYLSAGLTLTGWVRRTAFLDIPYFWVDLAPTIAFGLMTIYSAWFLTMLLRGQALPVVDIEEQM